MNAMPKAASEAHASGGELVGGAFLPDMAWVRSDQRTGKILRFRAGAAWSHILVWFGLVCVRARLARAAPDWITRGAQSQRDKRGFVEPSLSRKRKQIRNDADENNYCN